VERAPNRHDTGRLARKLCAHENEFPHHEWENILERGRLLGPPETRWKGVVMPYVITEPCIGTKDNSCVEVCPVDCIHPTPEEPGYEAAEMLYIDPTECIDCDACVEACPVDAIFSEEQVPTAWQHYIARNAEYYQHA
jgi:ferredoxin